jgi:hypothetical protein
MNSVEALDVAIVALSDQNNTARRAASKAPERAQEVLDRNNAALDTLQALRQLIIDNDTHLEELATEVRL